MRESASESDSRVFEVSLTSGCITWVNSKAEALCGKVVGASLHGMILQTHRDKLLEVVSDAMNGKIHRRTIWPVQYGDTISWWETTVIELSEDLAWIECKIAIKTPMAGDIYEMAAIISAYTGICAANNCEIAELKKELLIITESFKEEDTKIKSAIRAAGKAADATMENAHALDSLTARISNKFDEHTVEILKLISTDAMHDARMKAFEEHVRKTTVSAVKSIVSQADKAGRGLSKRVTIPVGVIAAILTFIQWLIVNWQPMK